MNATLNWWGSNNDPSGYVNSGVDVSPWLVLTVTSDNSTILVGGNSTVTAYLQHDSNNTYHDPKTEGHVPDGIPVTFNLSDTSLGSLSTTSATLTNGTAVTNFTATSTGIENVTATVDNQNNSTLITINKLNTTINIDNVTIQDGQTASINATLTDQNNKPIEGQDVSFKVNNETFTGTTNNKGIATLTYTPTSAGSYLVAVNYAGGVNYLDSSGNGTLTVTQLNTTLTVGNVTVQNGQTATVNATLRDENGNPLSGQTVLFTVNGKTYTETTNSSGVTTLTYTSTSAGSYTVTASYNGSVDYLTSVINGTLVVDPVSYLYVNVTTSSSNLYPGDEFVVTYKLSNSGPDSASNVKLTFKIPEGLKFISANADTGNCTYDPTTMTVTWFLDTVPVGDPYLNITLKALTAGDYTITPTINTTTYNKNTNTLTPLEINIQTPNNNGTNGSGANNNQNNTIPMQKTGAPLTELILGILAVMGGTLIPRRKH